MSIMLALLLFSKWSLKMAEYRNGYIQHHYLSLELQRLEQED
jgi:hypothetical protein